MRSGLTGENEIKIFILYLMDQIKHGVRYDDIANMTYESGYVGYFDFADVFSKLIDSGDISELESGGENIYNITQRGKAIAENLEHLLPAASKTKGIAVAARYSDLKKSGASHSHTLEEEPGGYRFKCKIIDKPGDDGYEKEMLGVSLFIKDRATAEKISEKFSQNPGAVYRAICAMLTGDAAFLF